VTPATAPGAVEEPLAPSDRLSRSPHPDAPAAAEARARRRRLVGFALVLGALLRLAQYAVNRSLWLDEALLVSNFLDRSWAGLLEPFHRGQTSPLGFLALEKLAVAALGRSEYALRLVPLMAGLATLALLPRVARRFATRAAFPLAVALVALAPFLVYYSSEVKQYAFDALSSLVVLALAYDLARRPRDGRLLAAFCAAGVVAVWLSQPVVFMLAGTGAVLGLRALRRGDRRSVALLTAVAAAWVASFAGAYLVARHQLEDPAYMKAFWRTGFLPLAPRTLQEWSWIPRMLLARPFREPMGIVGLDRSPLSLVTTAGAMAAFAAGFWWMRRHRRLRLALLLAPAGFALAASALRVYPFAGELLSGGRVLIFLLPSLAFVMAEGVHALRRLVPGSAGRAAFAAALALVLLPAAAYAAFSVPHLRGEVKPLLEFVNEERRPGDLMYVYYNGQAVFEYYAPRYGWDRRNTVPGACSRFTPGRYADDLARLRGRPRVWVLIVDGAPMDGFDEKKFILAFLDHVGKRLDDRVAVGAGVYLYDLRTENTRPGPFTYPVPVTRPDPALDCRGAWEPLSQLR
jgi:hypothetical protein